MESHGFLGCLPWKTADENFPLDVVVKNSVVTLLVISIITEGLLVVHFRYYFANTEEVVWLTLAIPLRNRFANLQLVLGNIILSCGGLRRHDAVVFLRNAAVSWDSIFDFPWEQSIVAVLRSFQCFFNFVTENVCWIGDETVILRKRICKCVRLYITNRRLLFFKIWSEKKTFRSPFRILS